MLKITEKNYQDNVVQLDLEGKIIGEWVDELNSVCNRYLESRRELILNLSHVNFVNEQGVAILNDLSRRSVRLTDCSLFLKALLENGNAKKMIVNSDEKKGS
jgi:anti-anti-sigma regulatory factor